MNKRTAICNYLKKYHTGKERAVYSEELGRLFSLSKRGIQHNVAVLRQRGQPICSGVTGYFYAANQSEIDETISRLESIIESVSETKQAMRHTSAARTVSLKTTVQVKLR